MSDRKYQVTTFGTGFRGPGHEMPDQAVDIARDKLLKIAAPYHFHGATKEEHPRPEILNMLEKRVVGGEIGEKCVFGHIFPPDGDCSGLVVRAVQEVRDITLPHLSEGIRVDDRVRTFHDHDDTASGDFIFYHFSDRNGAWPHADDITMVVDDDLQIGARPSRGGVAIFEREPEHQWLVEYGRLKT